MIQFRTLTKDAAAEWVKGIDYSSDAVFHDLEEQWKKHNVCDYDSNYDELREKVIVTYKRAQDDYKDESKSRRDYYTDLKVGFVLYGMLSLSDGFSIVKANDDDIWRYMSCKVFPDITYLRYPKSAKGDIRLAKKRFYSHPRRIWVKTLWWFIHLSWQGDEEKTLEVLEKCNIDAINKVFEQPGKGFRTELSREIIKQYALTVNNKSSKKFESIQKQNLVNCRTVEPALTVEKEEGYVRSLIEGLSGVK